ncbi:MAG: OmpA family protein [Rikenellaceae bacterium]|nr:OmpA family protein [Rikenellaceae bacterium]
MRITAKLLILCTISTITGGCVSMRKYDSARAEILSLQNTLDKRNAELEQMYHNNGLLTSENKQLTDNKLSLEKQIEELIKDTTTLGIEKQRLVERYKILLAQGSEEASRMLEELSRNQADLNARSARIAELEQTIAARDKALNDIRQKVEQALLGFDGKGLSISRRDGKVYVSMNDKLLFRSGSFEIESEGARAVRQLSDVLAANPDIDIMVEGHTDNIPYRGTGQLRDNLDLSVKRATTVTRLLLENKSISPLRVISAGRGEYMPLSIDNSAEARALNRRTEIILSPKLDQLLELTK